MSNCFCSPVSLQQSAEQPAKQPRWRLGPVLEPSHVQRQVSLFAADLGGAWNCSVLLHGLVSWGPYLFSLNSQNSQEMRFTLVLSMSKKIHFYLLKSQACGTNVSNAWSSLRFLETGFPAQEPVSRASSNSLCVDDQEFCSLEIQMAFYKWSLSSAKAILSLAVISVLMFSDSSEVSRAYV